MRLLYSWKGRALFMLGKHAGLATPLQRKAVPLRSHLRMRLRLSAGVRIKAAVPMGFDQAQYSLGLVIPCKRIQLVGEGTIA